MGAVALAATLVPESAATAVMLASIGFTIAGLSFYSTGGRTAYDNYLLGFLAPPTVGVLCAISGFTVCPPEIPQIPGISEFLAAVGAWGAYEAVGVIGPLLLGDPGAAGLVVVGFILPALLLALLG